MEKENEEKWKRFLLFHIKTNMYRDKQNNLNFQHRIEERRRKKWQNQQNIKRTVSLNENKNLL